MKSRPTLLVTAFLGLSVGLFLSAGVWASQHPRAVSAPHRDRQVLSLGRGRHVAIIPAALGPNDTYQQNPAIDTYALPASPSHTSCDQAELPVGYTRIGDLLWKYRYSLGFDLSSIPADATVSSARVYAYMSGATGKSPVTLAMRSVQSAWNCGLNWANMPSSLSTTSSSVNSSLGWKSWNITSLVQNDWIGRSFGSGSNHGLELRGPESGGTGEYYIRSFNSATRAPTGRTCGSNTRYPSPLTRPRAHRVHTHVHSRGETLHGHLQWPRVQGHSARHHLPTKPGARPALRGDFALDSH